MTTPRKPKLPREVEADVEAGMYPALGPESYVPNWREKFQVVDPDDRIAGRQVHLMFPPLMVLALDRQAARAGWSRQRLILAVLFHFLIEQGVDCSSFKYEVFHRDR